MHECRTKLGDDGRVIIPAVWRKLLNLKPGAELVISMKDNALNLLSTDELLKRAQALVKKYAHNRSQSLSLTAKLKHMREEEACNESER